VRLSLVIANLGCGGAQRVLVLLADAWAARGHEVELLTLEDKPLFFHPAPGVSVTRLAVSRASSGLFDAFGQLQTTVRALQSHWTAHRPEVVVAFTTRVNIKAILAARALNLPVVISERTDPVAARESLAWRVLRRWVYPRARFLVVQHAEAAAFFAPWGWGDGLQVLANPVPTDPAARRRDRNGTLVVSIGRLDRKKGHDLLLQAFAKVITPGARLRIVGDGPERSALEVLAADLGLAGRCEFVGESAQPSTHLRDADVFVLPSRVEGFPNALAEALAAGLATVSFDCPSGPRQLVRSGENGLLVAAEDIEALARSLDAVLGDGKLRQKLEAAAPPSVAPWTVDTVADRWLGLLRAAVE
jgi:glycosyltransferase involved in cell wall biosynthesis